jgi:hypothetical protein
MSPSFIIIRNPVFGKNRVSFWLFAIRFVRYLLFATGSSSSPQGLRQQPWRTRGSVPSALCPSSKDDQVPRDIAPKHRPAETGYAPAPVAARESSAGCTSRCAAISTSWVMSWAVVRTRGGLEVKLLTDDRSCDILVMSYRIRHCLV